ncbi:MAG: stage V sporulation protein AE [Bacillota bacterium]
MEYLYAFLIGGAICTIGQVLLSKTNLTSARILVMFVSAGVVLTIFGIYQPVVAIGGSGATVPLSGFGYALAKGAMEAAKQEGIVGAITGGLSATAAGITAAVLFGYLASVIFNPKSKK